MFLAAMGAVSARLQDGEVVVQDTGFLLKAGARLEDLLGFSGG
jgi:hypothetical protein